ncbi:MAG: DUF359 domain-containing protein [Candidatus Thermoplasmatota archaeon]|nr:DUF359 domain-containing protein [Candidatus Thermoplasmatota archaeon]
MKKLPENLRERLKEPIGPVMTGKELAEVMSSAERLITVGDVVTGFALENGITPHLSLVDRKTRREENLDAPCGDWDREAWVSNPPGMISDILVTLIEIATRSMGRGKKTLVMVDGEEDMASLPCISLAPEGTTVIYGLPDVGAAVVVVSDETRKIAEDIIHLMEEI